MIDAFTALPVTFGPHEADWWMVGASAAAAIGTTAAAFAAFRGASKAQEIADTNAKARIDDNDARVKERYDDLRRDATVTLLTALAMYIREADEARAASMPTPSMAAILGALEPLGVALSDGDFLAYGVFRKWLDVAARDRSRRRALVRSLMTTVLKWGRGELSDEALLVELRLETGAEEPFTFAESDK